MSGLAAAMGLVYFRLAVVIMSYVATPFETGIYSTAFRMVEVLTSLPWLAVATGFHPAADLTACEPDLFFPDFSDVSAALAALTDRR